MTQYIPHLYIFVSERKVIPILISPYSMHSATIHIQFRNNIGRMIFPQSIRHTSQPPAAPENVIRRLKEASASTVNQAPVNVDRMSRNALVRGEEAQALPSESISEPNHFDKFPKQSFRNEKNTIR